MRDQSKPVRKTLNKIRKMNYWQRILIMDWLKDWYAYEKETEAAQLAEEPDLCICIPDEPNVDCEWCY